MAAERPDVAAAGKSAGLLLPIPDSSLGVGGDDQVTATYTITWTVTWTGSDGTSGAFNGMQTQTASRFAVAEAQTVVVR